MTNPKTISEIVAEFEEDFGYLDKIPAGGEVDSGEVERMKGFIRSSMTVLLDHAISEIRAGNKMGEIVGVYDNKLDEAFNKAKAEDIAILEGLKK